MGGGPAELLLCVLPWEESQCERILKEIKEEFAKLEVKYIHVPNAFRSSHDVGDPVSEDLIKRANVLATLGYLPENAEAAPNLSLIQFFSAGVNHIQNHPIYTDSKIPLASANGVHGPQISEWVLMTNLINSHAYNAYYESQRKNEWKREVGGVRDAVGQRVGILGYGSIGRQVARVFKAMGGDVIAYTASPRKDAESKQDKGFIVPGTGDPDGSIPSAWYSGLDKESLHEFLRQKIDLLVISVPLTKQTTHLLSADEFDVLAASNPNKTLVSNISRGKIIDQPALVEALHAKKLRGAALDVTDPEPLPEDDPLWNAPDIIITPHISGGSVVYAERAMQVLQENMRRRAKGEEGVNIIDRDRGY